MVVGFAITTWRRARGIALSLPRATVLLAGLAVPSPQPGGLSLSSPALQLQAIEGLAGISQMPAITSPASNFLSPLGSSDSSSSLSLSFNSSSLGLLLMQRSSPAVTALLDNTLSAGADQSGAGTGGPGPVPTSGRTPRRGTKAACGNDQLTMRLQTGGEFWTPHAVSGAPVRFPPGVFTGSIVANANPLVLGPRGDRSNLPSPGPAGDWCRPPPVPFARSSPLASRIFWTPVAVVLAGIAVFWLSRGLKTPI